MLCYRKLFVLFFLVTLTVWEVASNAKSDVKRGDGEDGLDEVRFELVADLYDKSTNINLVIHSTHKNCLSTLCVLHNYKTHLRCQRLLQGENHACSLKAVDGHREVEREALKRELSRMYLQSQSQSRFTRFRSWWTTCARWRCWKSNQ